ncbi:MAG: alpha/beta fold hydrolase [Saprospiraceae bacterium]
MIWLDRYNLTRQRSADLTWAKNNRPNTQILDFKTTKMRIRDEGSGKQTLLFITDPPNVIEHYDELFDLFKTDYRVVVTEHPGQGFSVHKSSFDFSLAAHTHAIEELILHLKLRNIILVLPCVATYIGLPLAAKYPDLIKKVILAQAPNWSEQKKWVKRIDPKGLLTAPFIGQFYLASAKRKQTTSKIWYKISLGNREQFPHFYDLAKTQFEHQGCYCLASMLQGTMAEQTDFQNISQPTAIIWGLNDKSHLPTDKRTTLQFAPHANYHEWDDAGHFPHLQQLKKFYDVVRELGQ